MDANAAGPAVSRDDADCLTADGADDADTGMGTESDSAGVVGLDLRPRDSVLYYDLPWEDEDEDGTNKRSEAPPRSSDSAVRQG